VILGQILLRGHSAAGNARANHKAVCLFFAGRLARRSRIAILLLVNAVKLDQLFLPRRKALARAVGQVIQQAPAKMPALLLESLDAASLTGTEVREAFPVVSDLAVDWALRSRVIRSFQTLFREFFAVRCAPTLGHLSEGGSALNSACYMWWDFDCWLPAPDPLTRNPYDLAMLSSMRSILAIDHIACKESALHGLGHWHHAQGSAVESIIDEFLKDEGGLPERLREYAMNARRGYVL